MTSRHAPSPSRWGSWLYGTRRRDERGMVAVWVSVSLVAFIMVIGIGVDFAGHAAASQDARAVAAEAARAGGQHLTLDSGQARPDVHAAITAANTYVASSSWTSSAKVTGGDSITVTATGRYETKFISIIGISSLRVSGTGTAAVKSVLGGAEQ